MVVERVRRMSVEDFLDFAEQSEEWYEYIDGEPVRMELATYSHNVIITAVLVSLERQICEIDCMLLGPGMLVKAGPATLVAPDVSVVCGEPETEADTRILLNPTVVVEVISPTSVNHDRVVKRDFYESVASIQAYLIIDQHRPLAELYTRSATGWQLQTFTSLDDEVALDALACQLPLRDIYQKIDFEDGTGAPAGAES